MVRINCDICGASKPIPCERCGMNVCRSHRDQYFDEESESFILLCHNCGRSISATLRTYRRKKRHRYR